MNWKKRRLTGTVRPTFVRDPVHAREEGNKGESRDAPAAMGWLLPRRLRLQSFDEAHDQSP
ncbi:MAG: hypothetical protein PHF70_12400 [Opitutales bacterium]|nr:hypothetical protein [Opitutales bacterium]